jgi:hypothetical protein
VQIRFSTIAVVACAALVTGALSIALTLVSLETDEWPKQLQPLHRWGWPAVFVLLGAAVVLAVWQAVHQDYGQGDGLAVASDRLILPRPRDLYGCRVTSSCKGR